MTKKSDLMNKSLIIVVIILFFGAAVIPSISGYEKKTNLQSEEKAPVISLLDCDYVNSYWRFNECEGDIAVDSCSPCYNGTIHGATWSGGGGDCALLFDGVDDYVNFTSYAAELGFNKTDDFIISFIFQSTGEGIILSGCAEWGFNPDFQIELLSNGSLLFKLIGSSHLGIKLYSSEGYNDGTLHYVEYYHMGISTDPTVLVYVDDYYDNSMTSYYYNMENDEYIKFKMGVNAHSSIGYFDGLIDDFKIIKYERGNKQNPPVIDGPIYGKPNVEYDYSFITDDPEEDNISIDIDWGDGIVDEDIGPFMSGEEAIVSHKWTEEGDYYIKAKSQDFWGDSAWSEPYPLSIGNQPPYPPIISGPRYGDPGQQLTYTFVTNDSDGDDVKYQIDWDDDGPTLETGFYASGAPITETHSWGTTGDYFIKARAIDKEGKIGDWSEPYHIRIGDQPPSIPTINGDISGKPETEIDFIFSSNDPENDQIWYDIKWGDGNEIIDDGPYDSGQLVTKSYTWNKTNTYIIEARVRDDFGYYSEWESHSIKIPRYKAVISPLFHWFLERFSLLERLLNLLE